MLYLHFRLARGPCMTGTKTRPNMYCMPICNWIISRRVPGFVVNFVNVVNI
jgi:hypothetical protein